MPSSRSFLICFSMALGDIFSIFDNSHWVTVGLFRIIFILFSLLFSLLFSPSSSSAEGVISTVLLGEFPLHFSSHFLIAKIRFFSAYQWSKFEGVLHIKKEDLFGLHFFVPGAETPLLFSDIHKHLLFCLLHFFIVFK